jgi:hypothetical protein
MRSTRATAAIARLHARTAGHHYTMVLTGSGQFMLTERIEGSEKPLSSALSLDDFVRFVDAMGPQTVPRVTKNDAAFARQLVKKTPA